jgi:hypothetical protein
LIPSAELRKIESVAAVQNDLEPEITLLASGQLVLLQWKPPINDFLIFSSSILV